MSLRTTSRLAARRLATQLNLTLDDIAMFADGADPHLTRSQIETMLHAVVDRHLAKLDRVALAAKSGPGFDVAQAKAYDKRAYWAYALLDAQGVTAVVRDEDRERMAADGLSELDIEAVQDHLAMLRVNELVPTKHYILRGMIEGVAAKPTAMNLAVAQGTYLRGMKLALAQSDRRYGGARIEDDGLVDRMMLAESDPPTPASSIVNRSVDRPADPPKVDAPTIPQFIPMADFAQFADRVVQQNDADEHWDEKTQQQAKSIANLFVKFMVQDQRILDLGLLRQQHVGKFVDFLRFDIYKHYGKSTRDEQLTIEQLREKGRSVVQAKRGIGGGTLNRHATFLGQIFDHAIARGVKSLESIDLTKLRAKSRSKNKRARDERRKLPIDSAKAIFQTPPFINCAGWDDLGKWGEQGGALIFHCALYFVPILIYYSGARREELCGAMVDDIIFDREGCIPYIHIGANEQRRIKNAQSKRNIPLHPELIRLGFLDYVSKIKALGYKLLFPDLYSPSTRSPLGNRFYKLFKPILTAAKITEEGLGAHAVRHLFGAQLKKKLLSKEDRADLLGHGGDSETSERYCEPHELDTLFEFIMKLDVVTDHLEPQAVNLIPWVESMQVAPFSQPSRAKKPLVRARGS
nr:tyrosine-type recombinase/integrase [Bradyrhizobium vignae]